MITKSNLLSEYPRIFQSALPKPLQQEEFDFVAENMDLYDDAVDVEVYCDNGKAKALKSRFGGSDTVDAY